MIHDLVVDGVVIYNHPSTTISFIYFFVVHKKTSAN